jgi:hypothetical protein
MNIIEKMLKVINQEKITFKTEIKVREDENSAPIYISEIRKTNISFLVQVEVGADKAPVPLKSLSEKALRAIKSRLENLYPEQLKTAKIF